MLRFFSFFVTIRALYLLFHHIKIASGGARGGDNSGMMLVFSQETLRLETMLLDEGVLTEMRTAAASCLDAVFFGFRNSVRFFRLTEFLLEVKGQEKRKILLRKADFISNFSTHCHIFVSFN